MDSSAQPAAKIDECSAELATLINRAVEIRSRAYCPYSNFHVGAAILCHDGNVFTGVNVENASYGLSLCAERAAIVNAVTHGYTKFKAIAVSSDIVTSFKAPCGACRQVLVEFGMDWDLYIIRADRTWKRMDIKDLLPAAFTPSSLLEERQHP